MRSLNLNIDTREEGQFDIDPRLGQKIRELRKERGMTIRELSEAVGCSTTHVTRIELGQRRVDSMSLLVSFAQALHVPIEDLLSISGQSIQQGASLVKVAFPGVQTAKQEEILMQLSKLVSGMGLTDTQLDSLLEHATAYAEYCQRREQ